MDIKEISDIHIHTLSTDSGLVLDLPGSLIFPGPREANEEEKQLLRALFDYVKGNPRREFSARIKQPFDALFRVQRVDTAVDGTWFRLRRTTLQAPALLTLPSRLPAYIENLLLSPELSTGGLILISGQPGSGKTTTASAIVASRLMAYGGFAYTVEDPPEILALNGWHGDGYCTQTEVYTEMEGGWEASIRDLLRSQPVGSKLILYVGEIRSVEAARMMIRAASNGFLVITTTFATDLISAIDTLYQMLGTEYATSLASVLRVVVYQRIRSEPVRMIEAQALYSEGASSRVAVLVRSRQLAQLKDELTYQINAARRQQNMGGTA